MVISVCIKKYNFLTSFLLFLFKVDFLIKVLKLASGLGATGVLLEWEDMFPFTGSLMSVAAKNHYSADDVRRLLKECKTLGMDVIPLVQTFGKWR